MAVVPSVEKEETATKNEGLAREVSMLEGLKKSTMELESQYSAMLPKVSPRLIADLSRVQRENPNKLPIFTLEVCTKKVGEGGIDADIVREHIWNTTGKMPAIYDNGTHYVTNQRLTFETLKRLNDFEHVLKVTGEYSGGGYASSVPNHECSTELDENRREPLLKAKKEQGKDLGSKNSAIHNNRNRWYSCIRRICYQWWNSTQRSYQRGRHGLIVFRSRARNALWICGRTYRRLASDWSVSSS
jgi:hypothetical protein